MNEPVSFWLENRNCAGIKAAELGDQVLVLYRDRYYVVTGGAAQTRAGKPLRFSLSSLPATWKRALKGEVLPPVTLPSETEVLPTATTSRRERKKTEEPVMTELHQETAPEKSEKTDLPLAKARRKGEAKPVHQPPVVANCPYCNARHEIPVEKGKNGKPFFLPCSRCKAEFAVRFVQVTLFQAQVAGFR